MITRRRKTDPKSDKTKRQDLSQEQREAIYFRRLSKDVSDACLKYMDENGIERGAFQTFEGRGKEH
jgi:hypothetical protein